MAVPVIDIRSENYDQHLAQLTAIQESLDMVARRSGNVMAGSYVLTECYIDPYWEADGVQVAVNRVARLLGRKLELASRGRFVSPVIVIANYAVVGIVADREEEFIPAFARP